METDIKELPYMDSIRKLLASDLIPHLHQLVKLQKYFKDCVKITLCHISLGKLLIINLKISLYFVNDLTFLKKHDSLTEILALSP